MKRRIFLMMTFYLFTRMLSAKLNAPTHWKLIESVLHHLFPKTSNFSGALNLNMISFFKLVSKDKYFDNDDLLLLIKGTKRLYKADNNFINLPSNKKEILLRKFEQSSLGRRWLSILLYYGFESMLADPIYGGNKNQYGWKDLGHNAGLPQPKKRYGKDV